MTHAGNVPPVRVLHVFGRMDIGGAELRTLELMEAVQPQGLADFMFLTLRDGPGALDERIHALGGRVVAVPLNPISSFAWRLWRTLKETSPDVVDSHVSTASGLILVIAKWAGVPGRIAHFRSEGDGRPSIFRRRLQRRVMRLLICHSATHVVGVSPAALQMAVGTGVARGAVIPNGIAAQSELLAEVPEPGTMLLVGRPVAAKNRSLAVQVLATLRSRGMDVALTLAGGVTGDEDGVVGIAQRESVDDVVTALPFQGDVLERMARSHLVLLPSIREGLPGVVLEALSVGTPVVATALPGCQYVAQFCPSGITLVPKDASVVEWADAVETALAYAPGAKRAEIVQEFANSPFELSVAVEKHLQLYRDSASKRDYIAE